MKLIEATIWRRLLATAGIASSVVALGACGGDDDSPASESDGGADASANSRDTARVRLLQCLRDQGLDVPDDIGQSGTPPPDLDEDALEDALLVNRLRDLEAAGVVGRVLVASPQSAVVYELTDRGRALRPTVEALQAWGEANSDPPDRRTSWNRARAHAHGDAA